LVVAVVEVQVAIMALMVAQVYLQGVVDVQLAQVEAAAVEAAILQLALPLLIKTALQVAQAAAEAVAAAAMTLVLR
jgi:hypothetical protein